ncbi:MAG: PcfJ domain-containing protein, partial [Christensenella sp.]
MKDRWKQPIKFLQLSARIPAMEVMIDTKDTGALFAALTGQIQLKNGARTPAAAVGLTKAEYKRSFDEKWDIYKLIIYKKLAMRGWIASAEELNSLYSCGQFSEKVKNLKVGETMNVKRVWFYLNRILNKRFERGIIEAKDIIQLNDVLHTYNDYLRFYRQLNSAEPKTDDAIYPYDLYERHDRLMARGREIDRQNKIAKEERNALKFKAMWEKIKWADYADDTFVIRAARSTAELIDEGDALHHCVGGYTENVISGDVIFFIRKAGTPDVPYYTLNINIKTGKMIQLHGYANSDRAP